MKNAYIISFSSDVGVFRPPTLEKLYGHIFLGLSLRPSVSPCVHSKIYLDTVLKFHILIPHQKTIDTYFSKSGLSPFVELCPF